MQLEVYLGAMPLRSEQLFGVSSSLRHSGPRRPTDFSEGCYRHTLKLISGLDPSWWLKFSLARGWWLELVWLKEMSK